MSACYQGIRERNHVVGPTQHTEYRRSTSDRSMRTVSRVSLSRVMRNIRLYQLPSPHNRTFTSSASSSLSTPVCFITEIAHIPRVCLPLQPIHSFLPFPRCLQVIIHLVLLLLFHVKSVAPPPDLENHTVDNRVETLYVLRNG